ncbi:hypothetical protein [Cupriavidus basilensis]|uniref:hypothetical protein n=1 Tax=Cupriavidus basilensis TaxID=68895 RepID=UPI0039F6C37A
MSAHKAFEALRREAKSPVASKFFLAGYIGGAFIEVGQEIEWQQGRELARVLADWATAFAKAEGQQ